MAIETFKNSTGEDSKSNIVERIKCLYEDVKDISELKCKYRAAKSKAVELMNEIKELEKTKEEIILDETRKEIAELEMEYARVFRMMNEMDENEAKTQSITQDLLRSLNNITNTECRGEQAIALLSRLIVPKRVTKQLAMMLFNESGPVFLVAISTEVEALVNSFQAEPFYKEFTASLRHRISECLPGISPENIRIFKGSSSIYLVCDIDGTFEEVINMETKSAEGVFETSVKEYRFGEVCRDFPVVGKTLGRVLKDNLAVKVIEDKYTFQRIDENNRLFESTEFYIKNIQEWVLDVLMKRMLVLSKETRTLESAVAFEGTHVSGEYLVLEKALGLFQVISSSRKDKAAVVLEKALVKFFEIPQSQVETTLLNSTGGIPKYRSEEETQLLFLYFSDVSCFIGKHKECVVVEKLMDVQERLLMLCIRSSAIINTAIVEQMKASPKLAKPLLKEIHYDFQENLRKFVGVRMRPLVTVQFFEEFYRNFIEKCLHEEFSENFIADLIIFVLDFSYGCDLEMVESYHVLKEHLSMIRSVN